MSNPPDYQCATTRISRIWLLLQFARSAAVTQTLKDVGSCPGCGRLLYNPFGGLSLAIDGFSPFKWRFHDYHAAFDLYAHFQSTVLSSFVIWNGEQYYWLSDADAIKTVCNSRKIFEKDLPVYEKFLNFWGSNIISTEGNEWKLHRGVARSAFNEVNNALVWSETTHINSQWMSNLKKEVEVDLLEDSRLITMQVIQGAGFGRHPTWAEASSKQSDGD
ncbi:hypothetical protein D9758_005237 [Tetrapyrgos nigripes]|uniref:Cytochrome P450 n=1 Tax=Tetrapyrgos nigripes TaxID=182062 RepID=A0A8H5LWE8_9AGAR|nr:hypothetical protein D9758_005237 [Tetrapyrgos nigripes]